MCYLSKLGAFVGVLAVSATTASAASPTVRNMVYGGVESRHNISYQPQFQGFFYVMANAAMNLSNFKLTHKLDLVPLNATSDSYSFEQLIGFGAAAGYQFAEKWGVQLDWSYSGKFEDEDNVAKFSLSSQNFLLGLRYMLYTNGTTGFYTGFGVGASIVTAKLTGSIYAADGNESQDKTTIAANAVLGVQEFLNSNLALTFEYGLMYNGGMKISRYDTLNNDYLLTKVGGMLTNSFKLGLKYKF